MGDLNGNSIHFSGVPREVLDFMNGGGDLELPLESVEAPLSVSDVPKNKSIKSSLLEPNFQLTNSRKENSSRQNLKPIPAQLPAQATQSPANDEVTKTNAATARLPETELQSKFRQIMAILDKNPRLDVDSKDGKSLNGQSTCLECDIPRALYQEALDKAEKQRTVGANTLRDSNILLYMTDWLKKELKKHIKKNPKNGFEYTIPDNWKPENFQCAHSQSKASFSQDAITVDSEAACTPQEFKKGNNVDAAGFFHKSIDQALIHLRKEMPFIAFREMNKYLGTLRKNTAIRGLKQYNEKRKTKRNYHSKFTFLNPQKNSHKFFKNVFESVNETLRVFTQEEKTSAAEKLIKYIKNPKDDSIIFSSRQLGALQQGKLGEIVKPLLDGDVLHPEFFEQQAKRLAKQQAADQAQQKQSSCIPSLLRAALIFIPTLALIADCFLSGMDFVGALI